MMVAVLAAALSAGILGSNLRVAEAGPYTWEGGSDLRGWSEAPRSALFAEGTTRNGFEEYLVLRNPGELESWVTVSYLFPSPEEPRAHGFLLQPGAGTSICVNDAVGFGKDVSLKVESEVGILAERQMYFNYKGVWTGGHVTCGVSEPSGTWYFAEGTTRTGFKEWLCIQNPGEDAATVDLAYMLGTGETISRQLSVPACSRHTVDVNSDIGPERDVSVKIEASSPLVVERPMYFDYKSAWRGGHTLTGATELNDEWYFAEGTTRSGFEEWLCLMNPGDTTTARVEYLFADGDSETREYTLDPHARTTLFVNQEVGPEKDVSIRLTSGGRILCERPMYFRYHGQYEGGHVVMGATGGEPAWSLPSTCCGDDFESWLCLMNPGDEDNPVSVEVMGGEGGYHVDYLCMEPKSRFTVNLSAASRGIDSAWVRIEGRSEIVAERPVYFSYRSQVEPEPFTFATWSGLELKCPIRYPDLLGCVFHEASPNGGDGNSNNVQVMQPIGICLKDDNPAHRHPAVSFELGSDPAYFIEKSRGRGTYSTTACDVQARAGSTVYSPVDGTVLASEGYMLYGRYPDLRIRILIDGYPGYHMAVLHMDQLLVSKGERVEAGVTPIGVVRDLVPYFNSGPNPYTRDDGNHPHLQINYRPDMHL